MIYHAIIVDKSIDDINILNKYKIFNKKTDGNWEIIGVELKENELDVFITLIQNHLKGNNNWYFHIYDDKDDDLIVVFKNETFKITSDKDTWSDVILYGKAMKIPIEQLDFIPNTFKKEMAYFKI
jgi:hypothetical protein